MKPFVFSSLLLALAAGAALSSCSSTPPAPPVNTAGLRVQVTRVDYKPGKKFLNVRATIWNEHDQNVSFDFGQIRLKAGNSEASPKPGALRDRKMLGLQAKTSTLVDWDFNLPEEIAAGVYTIEMRDLKKGDAPLGEVASFAIEVKV